jgi:NitT/TauT family transport system substrate-binding protein
MRKLVAIAIVGALSLAACGSNGGDGGTPPKSGELTTVKVGLIPTIDVAPLYLAQERGTFKDHGLKVDFQEVQTGAASMAAVMSGEYQFGFAAPAPEIQAQAQGLPIEVVASAYASGEELSQAVVAPAGSDIKSLLDLQGKTVAVNALQAINDVVVRGDIEKAGGDHKKVNFIALPYPDMPAALDSGQVDAAFLIEPFLSGALASGAQVVLKNPQVELVGNQNTNLSSYFASKKYIEGNADTVKAFVDAVNEANDYAQKNPDEVRRIIPTYTAIKPEVAQKMAIGQFLTSIDRETFDVVGKYMHEFGWIKEQPDLDALLPKS